VIVTSPSMTPATVVRSSFSQFHYRSASNALAQVFGINPVHIDSKDEMSTSKTMLYTQCNQALKYENRGFKCVLYTCFPNLSVCTQIIYHYDKNNLMQHAGNRPIKECTNKQLHIFEYYPILNEYGKCVFSHAVN